MPCHSNINFKIELIILYVLYLSRVIQPNNEFAQKIDLIQWQVQDRVWPKRSTLQKKKNKEKLNCK